MCGPAGSRRSDGTAGARSRGWNRHACEKYADVSGEADGRRNRGIFHTGIDVKIFLCLFIKNYAILCNNDGPRCCGPKKRLVKNETYKDSGDLPEMRARFLVYPSRRVVYIPDLRRLFKKYCMGVLK